MLNLSGIVSVTIIFLHRNYCMICSCVCNQSSLQILDMLLWWLFSHCYQTEN